MDVAALTDRIEGWSGKLEHWEPLAGGITNRNLLLTVDGERYVLRLAGKNTELLGIDRHVELAAHRHAHELGVAPEVVGFLEPEGYLVTRFVDAEPVPDLTAAGVLEAVGSILRTVHGGPPLGARFDCFTIPQAYAATAVGHGGTLPPPCARALEVLDSIRAALPASPLVPAHNDLLNANFLGSPDGRLWLIDWEYAGMNDRWFDLGNLAVNNELLGEAGDALLAAYFDDGAVTAERRAMLDIFRVVSDVRESLWGVVQLAVSELDVDFRAYAERHADRLLGAASTPAFRAALALVAG